MAPAPAVIGVVAAMAREARLVRRVAAGSAIEVLLSGGGVGPRRARDAAHGLVDRGATLLLSTGYAGGLHDTVAAGDLLVPEWVVDEAGVTYTVAASARARVLAALAPPAARAGGAAAGSPAIHGGGVTGTSRVIASVADKRALATASGALGVDMESAAVAAVGRERAVPVLILRSVSDGVAHPVPRAVIGSTGASGRVSVASVLRGLARRPWELPALLRLAATVRTADATLADALGRALGALHERAADVDPHG